MSQEATFRLHGLRTGAAQLRTRLVQYGVEAFALSVSVALRGCGTSVGFRIGGGYTRPVDETLTTVPIQVTCP